MVPGSHCWDLEPAMPQLKWHETHPSALSRKIVFFVGRWPFSDPTENGATAMEGWKDDGKCHQKSAKIRATKTSRWPVGAIQDAGRKLAAAHRQTWISRDTDATKRVQRSPGRWRSTTLSALRTISLWLNCQLRRFVSSLVSTSILQPSGQINVVPSEWRITDLCWENSHVS